MKASQLLDEIPPGFNFSIFLNGIWNHFIHNIYIPSSITILCERKIA